MNGITKKVLIITDLSRASPRIPGLCKYLPEEGWDATILTPPLGKYHKERLVIPSEYARIIEIPFKDSIGFWKDLIQDKVNKSSSSSLVRSIDFKNSNLLDTVRAHLFHLGGLIFAYPDEMRGWRNPAIKLGKNLLKFEKFDAILSSSFPITSHLIARELTKLTRIPWLADLRDLWTQNHNYLFPKRKFFENRLEKNTLSKAHALSTVSDSLSKKLQAYYPSSYVSVITNGFDSDLVNQPRLELTNEFTITYTGLIYRDKQNPAKLFEVLRELIKEGKINSKLIQVRYYGPIQKWLTQLANKFEIQDIVTQYGPILRNEAIIKQRESQVLLLYGWEEEYETGVLPLKMFEYFAARRPILATGGTPNEQFRSILNTTKAGEHAIETPHIKTILYKYYSEFIEWKNVNYKGIPEEMDKYSYRHMAKKFSNVLNTIKN